MLDNQEKINYPNPIKKLRLRLSSFGWIKARSSQKSASFSFITNKKIKSSSKFVLNAPVFVSLDYENYRFVACKGAKGFGLTIQETAEQNHMFERYVRNAEHGGDNMSWRNKGLLLMFYKKKLTLSLKDDDKRIGKILTKPVYEAHL